VGEVHVWQTAVKNARTLFYLFYIIHTHSFFGVTCIMAYYDSTYITHETYSRTVNKQDMREETREKGFLFVLGAKEKIM
jgi:hypothetical protein